VIKSNVLLKRISTLCKTCIFILRNVRYFRDSFAKRLYTVCQWLQLILNKGGVVIETRAGNPEITGMKTYMNVLSTAYVCFAKWFEVVIFLFAKRI
jgi:hypothetical protein